MTTLENPDDLRSDFERYREYERRRKVTRVILVILLVLFVLFLRLMPLDWASGNISNLFGVTNIFNNGSGPGSGSGPVSSPSSSSNGGNGGGTGQETVDGSGQINYIVGSPGPVGPAGGPGKNGAQGAPGPAGKDGTFSQVGFGQSQATIGICDDAVNVSLRSTWNKNLGTDGNFALSLIKISNVSTDCNGLNLFVDLLDENGDSMLSAPLEIAAIDVGSTGEIVFTSRTHPQLLSVISNQIDKFLMEVAS